MGYRPGDELITIEGKIEAVTLKAYLVIPTMGPAQVWIPKSQIASSTDPDADGNILFEVTKWWYDKQEGFE